jgi:hypothetical protein
MCIVAVWSIAVLSLAAAPVFELPQDRYDFGAVQVPGAANYEIRFRNGGDAVLEIGKIKTSCGCTVAALEQRSYEPGATGVVKVALTVSHPGANSKQVTIETNDPEKRYRVVTVTAEGKDFISTTPARAEFGSVALSQPVSRTVRITSTDGTAFRVLDSRPPVFDGVRFTVSAAPIAPDAAGAAMAWDITVSATAERYPLVFAVSATLQLDHPVAAHLTVAIAGRARHPLRLDTGGRRFLGAVAPGAAVSRVLVLTSDETPAFALESVSSSSSAFTVEQEAVEPGRRYRLRLTAQAPADGAGRFYSTRLTIRTDRDVAPTIDTSFSVHVVAPDANL